MLTNKQRSYLTHLAHDIPDIVFIGKSGITDNIINQVRDNLKARELIKCKVQQNCPQDVKDIANELADIIKCDLVRVVGSKFILYKKNQKNKVHVIPNKKDVTKRSKRIGRKGSK